MPELPQRWRRDGGPAVALPFSDQSADRMIWTDLANNPEARAACGWAPAEPLPAVKMQQARLALRDLGLLDELDAWCVEQGGEIQSAWRGNDEIRRHAPLLLEAAQAKGWDAAFLDELFFAAEAVPL